MSYNKTGIIHLSKLPKFIFRKSHYVTFGKKMERTLSIYNVWLSVYWIFKITSIGFEWKKSFGFLVWVSFALVIYQRDFIKRVRGLASHQSKFHFDSCMVD